MAIIYAPWTDDQVAALNRWQASDMVHPFTCGNRGGDSYHERAKNFHRDNSRKLTDAEEADALVATRAGWNCPFCDYTQNWAHDFMLNLPPEHPFVKMRKPNPS